MASAVAASSGEMRASPMAPASRSNRALPAARVRRVLTAMRPVQPCVTVRARMRPGTTSCSPGATTRRTWVPSRPRMRVTRSSGMTEPTVMTASMRSACRVWAMCWGLRTGSAEWKARSCPEDR